MFYQPFLLPLRNSHNHGSRSVVKYLLNREAHEEEVPLREAITNAKGFEAAFRPLAIFCQSVSSRNIWEWDLQKTRKHLTRCLSRWRNFCVSMLRYFFFVASLCQAIVSAVCVFAQQPSNNTKTTERKLVPNNSLSDPDGYGILCAYIEIDMYTFGRYFMLRVRYVFAIISSPGGERGVRQQNEMIKCVFLCK